ncbi:MAG: hypothetical protein ABWJ99_05470 [Caldimicrobium sp.]
MKLLKGGLVLLFIFSLIPGFFLKAEKAYSQEIDLESYDPNTEMVIEGEIQKIIIPDRGMVSLTISKDGKLYQAFLCPRWFYFQLRPDLKLGDRVVIKGAKIYSRRHGLIFTVRVIKNLRTKEEIVLRNEICEPCWRGQKRGFFR